MLKYLWESKAERELLSDFLFAASRYIIFFAKIRRKAQQNPTVLRRIRILGHFQK